MKFYYKTIPFKADVVRTKTTGHLKKINLLCFTFLQNHLCLILGGWDIGKPKWDSEMDTLILVMLVI